MSPLRELYNVTKKEKEFIESLGLVAPEKYPKNQKYIIGTKDFEDGSSVNIWVNAMPARFWEFEIIPSGINKTVTMSTGSGSLSDFWGSIELIASNMLAVGSIKSLELNIILVLDNNNEIEINLTGDGGGAIASTLKISDTEENEEYNAAIDGIESMILAHAIAEIDVASDSYKEGILTAIQSMGNEF